MRTAVAVDDPGAGDQWVSTAMAAEYLGVTLRTLYWLVDRGDLEAGRSGRVIRIRLASLKRYRGAL